MLVVLGKGLAMQCSLAFVLISVLAVLVHAAPSTAIPIIVNYSGLIDTVDDPLGELPAGIGVGTPFSGTYTIDPDSVSSVIELNSSGLVGHGGAQGLGWLGLGAARRAA